MCFLKLIGWLKSDGHNSHLYLALLWMLRCSFKVVFWVKALEQIWQTWGLMPSWCWKELLINNFQLLARFVVSTYSKMSQEVAQFTETFLTSIALVTLLFFTLMNEQMSFQVFEIREFLGNTVKDSLRTLVAIKVSTLSYLCTNVTNLGDRPMDDSDVCDESLAVVEQAATIVTYHRFI